MPERLKAYFASAARLQRAALQARLCVWIFGLLEILVPAALAGFVFHGRLHDYRFSSTVLDLASVGVFSDAPDAFYQIDMLPIEVAKRWLWLASLAVFARAFAAIFVVVGFIQSRTRLSRWDDLAKLRKIERLDEPALWSVIERLASRIGVSSERIEVRFQPTRGMSPSLAIDPVGRPVIVVTFGAMVLLGRFPQAFAAMIAHELAHAYQRDGAIWGYSEAARLYLNRYFGHLWWVFAAVFFPVLMSKMNNFFPALALASVVTAPSFLVAGATRRVLLTLRAKSEQLADMAAELLVGREHLEHARSLLVGAHSDLHERARGTGRHSPSQSATEQPVH